MTGNVLELRRAPACADIVATLRRIADDIESGEHVASDWPATTAILVLGHETSQPDGADTIMARCDWTTHGFGPRADIFTVRGLLATVLGRGLDSGD